MSHPAKIIFKAVCCITLLNQWYLSSNQLEASILFNKRTEKNLFIKEAGVVVPPAPTLPTPDEEAERNIYGLSGAGFLNITWKNSLQSILKHRLSGNTKCHVLPDIFMYSGRDPREKSVNIWIAPTQMTNRSTGLKAGSLSYQLICDNTGILCGLETSIFEVIRGGIAFGYGSSNIHTRGLVPYTKTESDRYLAAIYSQVQSKKFLARGAIHSFIDASHPVVKGTPSIISSNIHTLTNGYDFGFAYNVYLQEGVKLSASIDLDIVHHTQRKFKTKLNGMENLSAKSSSTTFLSAPLLLKINAIKPLEGSIISASLSSGCIFGARSNLSYTLIDPTGLQYKSLGLLCDKNIGVLALGLGFNNDYFSIDTQYDNNFGKMTHMHAISATLSTAF